MGVVPLNSHQLAAIIKNCIENVLVLDSRSFLEYNTCHILHSVNVCCSKIVKRRLQQDKVTVRELLFHACQAEIGEDYKLVVYDQSSAGPGDLPQDSFVQVLLDKLTAVFPSVYFLEGGFIQFQASHPSLCEDKTRKCPLTSLSQPCLSHQGPTKILPFLYLGSQFDSLNRELLKDYNIGYTLNVSNSCPRPDFISDGHFLRIPVNDNYNEKLLPYFSQAFQFLDKVREASGCVLVHCLAGISRSPTIAIAYVMKHLRMTSDEAYRYVKSKRAAISPNFNFLGQLLEFEKRLRFERVLDCKPEFCSAPPGGLCGQKRFCTAEARKGKKLTLQLESGSPAATDNQGEQSPTTALAKLSFDRSGPPSPVVAATPPPMVYPKCRSRSCHAVMADAAEDSKVEWSTDDVRAQMCPPTVICTPAIVEPQPQESSKHVDAAKLSQTFDVLFECLGKTERTSSSGRGSESSDIPPPIQEAPDEPVFEEDLKDQPPVVLRKTCARHPELRKHDSGYLSLTLSDPKWPFPQPLEEVESPPSPSESHLLDDIHPASATSQSSARNSSSSNRDTSCQHDSGVLLSPGLLFPQTSTTPPSEGLHRAQSCPVIMGRWIHHVGSPDSLPPVKLRKTSHDQSIRHSIDLSQLPFHHNSSPDSLSASGSGGASLKSLDAAKSRVFRRPISLIQVS